MPRLLDRMIRAAKLDAALYEEVEADRGALGQATLVVVLSSLCAGVGSVHRAGQIGAVAGTLAALAGWYIWAFLTYWIGTKLLPEAHTRADYGELLRTIGFASAPGVIRIAGVVPGLDGAAFFAAAVWMLAAMILAVRQALDYTSTLRAVGVCLIGWLTQILVMVAVLELLPTSTGS